jgi:KDEL-tailed cysteine endopeptidase
MPSEEEMEKLFSTFSTDHAKA